MHSRVSGERDRLELPDRSRSLQVAPQVRDRLRRDRGHRLRAARHRARRNASTSCSTCSRRRSCGCTSCRKATSRPVAIRWRRRRRSPSSRRWSANSRSRDTSRTSRRSARTAASQQDGLQPVHRHLLDRRHHGRRRPCQGRAAPVHGLRRVRDGLPVGRDDLRLSVRSRISARGFARCSRPMRRPAGAIPACCCTPRMRRPVIATLARRARGLPARVIPLEVHHAASTGLDVWLAALAHGASQVAVLVTGSVAPAISSRARIADGALPTSLRNRWATRGSISAYSTAPTRRLSTPRCGRGRPRLPCARRRPSR